MHLASRQWLLFIPYLLVQAFVKHTHKNFTSMEGNQRLQLQSAVLLARDEEHAIRCWMTASKEESQLKASKALGKLLPGWLRPHERVKLQSSVHSRLEQGSQQRRQELQSWADTRTLQVHPGAYSHGNAPPRATALKITAVSSETAVPGQPPWIHAQLPLKRTGP